VGGAHNDGRGGPNVLTLDEPNPELRRQILAWCRANAQTPNPHPASCPFDWWATEQVAAHKTAELLKTNTVFVLHSNPDKQEILPSVYNREVARDLRGIHGNDLKEILNEH